MGYVVRQLKGNKKRPWKLQFQSEVGGDRKIRDIPTNELGSHQFNPTMTYEQAKERAVVMNRDSEIKRHAERHSNIKKRIEKETVNLAVSFPDEPDFLKWLTENQRFASIKENKSSSHWHNAKKIIARLGIKPTEYADKKLAIYKWFREKKLSMSYLKKILRLLNLYGKFYGKTYKVYFEEIPFPTGYERSDIEDAYFEKNPDGRDAKPLTPWLLATAQSKFEDPEHYNWMYISLWCGLRPSEVDALKDKKNFKVEMQDGIPILWFFQSKLKKIAREKRWKPIPLVEEEQGSILSLIRDGKFRRPLCKTIVAHLGEGFTTYSGRKGFEAVMRDRGHSLENVSQWLGHQSIERTWKNYVNKKVVRWKKSA